MTTAELGAWNRAYRRNLDHKIRLDRIRREGEERVRNIRATLARVRRMEENTSLTLLHVRVKCASSQTRSGQKSFPLELAQRWHDVRLELTNTTPTDEVPLLPIWRRDIEQQARALGVAIRDLVLFN